MLIIFYGLGKGKTSAAMGTALRAWGQGHKVLLFSFLKGRDISGEFKAIQTINHPRLQFHTAGRECPYPGQDCCPGQRECILDTNHISIEDLAMMEQGLVLLRYEIDQNDWTVLVLDEILNLYYLFPGLQAEINQLIDQAALNRDLILTGRRCPQALLARAALVSEMKLVKHPFLAGIPAKKGIDY